MYIYIYLHMYILYYFLMFVLLKLQDHCRVYTVFMLPNCSAHKFKPSSRIGRTGEGGRGAVF